MHEFSLVNNICNILDEVILKEKIKKINRVNIKVGKLLQVVPENMKYLFEVVSKGKPYKSAQLNIELTPVKGECGDCKFIFDINDYKFICPKCNGSNINIINGKELILSSIDAD
jgi:hydrogenase nickel incorporation protein HypA/HybF